MACWRVHEVGGWTVGGDGVAHADVGGVSGGVGAGGAGDDVAWVGPAHSESLMWGVMSSQHGTLLRPESLLATQTILGGFPEGGSVSGKC